MNSYKCENCGGKLFFDTRRGELVCESCGSGKPIKAKKVDLSAQVYYEQLDFKNYNVAQGYTCQTCGTNVFVGQDEEAHRCPSCGDTALKKLNNNTMMPNAIIPFQIPRDIAVSVFQQWVKTRKEVPRDLFEMAKTGKIIGFYAPFWLFTYDFVTEYSGWRVTESTDTDGNTSTYRSFKSGALKGTIESDRESGCVSIARDAANDFGYYNYKREQPFSSDYLVGTNGLDTNIDVHKAYKNLVARVKDEKKREAYFEVKGCGSYVEKFACKTSIFNIKFKYIYLPVWANYYKYKKNHYHCYINGQTGQARGKCPRTYWKIFVAIAGAVAGILAIVAGIIAATVATLT